MGWGLADFTHNTVPEDNSVAPTPALPHIFILLAQNKEAGEGVKPARE